MRGWERWEEDKVRRVEVHYCAYEHHYHKPTHLWTNLKESEWVPAGTTGTGKCEQRCLQGIRGQTGRWEHVYKLAQGSWQAKGGPGRKANKNMMPRALHVEILRAAGMLGRQEVSWTGRVD